MSMVALPQYGWGYILERVLVHVNLLYVSLVGFLVVIIYFKVKKKKA